MIFVRLVIYMHLLLFHNLYRGEYEIALISDVLHIFTLLLGLIWLNLFI